MTQSQKCGDKKTNTTKKHNIILHTVTRRVSMNLIIKQMGTGIILWSGTFRDSFPNYSFLKTTVVEKHEKNYM